MPERETELIIPIYGDDLKVYKHKNDIQIVNISFALSQRTEKDDMITILKEYPSKIEVIDIEGTLRLYK